MNSIRKAALSCILTILAITSVAAKDKDDLHQTIKAIAAKFEAMGVGASYVTAKGKPVVQQVSFLQEKDLTFPVNGNLRQIALIRHGEPDLRKTGKFSYMEARKFAVDYDSVGIVTPDAPFFEIQNPKEVAVFASSINRARATAQYVFGADSQMTVSPVFREFETAMGEHSPSLRMPIKFWTTAARIKWVLGIDRQGAESFADARRRAQEAAQILVSASADKPKVALVAHGLLNRYIQENLEDMGWHVVRDGGSGYLGTTILVKLDS
ncbi:alpha-ribazole phosphatase (plasmid) [Pontibacter sp. SGAir0037]|nr:alpha-ribazole phosphatase [Pontibacter sp. SGAir0037]